MDVYFERKYGPNMLRIWTPEEEAWLRAHKDEPMEYLERVLGRSSGSIKGFMRNNLIFSANVERRCFLKQHSTEFRRMVSEGMKAKDIAEHFDVSLQTVYHSIRRLKTKGEL